MVWAYFFFLAVCICMLLLCGSLLRKMHTPMSTSARRRKIMRQLERNKQVRLERLKQPNPVVGPGYPPAYLAEKAKSGVPPAPPPRPLATAPIRQRKPKNPNLARIECKCGKQVALTKLGKLYSHNDPNGFYCLDSGAKVFDYLIHEDPI